MGAGAIGLLVLLDPRTLPWIGLQLGGAWSFVSSIALALIATLRGER